MNKFLTIGTIWALSTPATIGIVSCFNMSTIKKEHSIKIPIYSRLNLDEEGFPIHKGTELVPGEGDLSVSRVVKHLRDYLQIVTNGSKISKVSLGLAKFGSDNLWDYHYFNDIKQTKQNTFQSLLWNSGNPSKDWKVEHNSYEKKGPLYEYISKTGWKRFMKKDPNKNKWIPEFDVLINAYPLLEDPTIMRMKMIVADKKYKEQNYVKLIHFGDIPNVVPANIKNIEYIANPKNPKQELANAEQNLANAKQNLANAEQNLANAEQNLANAEKNLKNAKQKLANAKQKLVNDKQIIKDIANFANWTKLFRVTPDILISNDALKYMSSKLDKTKNKTFIENHIDKLYDLFIKSPFLNLDKLPNEKKGNSFVSAVDFLNDKKRNHLLYATAVLVDYIEANTN